MKITKIIKSLFFLAVTLLIFHLIFRKVDFSNLKEVLSNTDLSYLIPAVLIFLLSPLISAKKWQSMLKVINYSICFKESLKIVMAAFPLSVITPSKSGDLIKAYYLRDEIPPSQTAGAVITERLIDVLILILYSFVGALMLGNQLILKITLFFIFLILLILLIINKINLPFSWWQEKIKNFLYISKIFIKRPQKSAGVLFYSLILWSIPIFGAKLLFLALGADIPLLYIVAAFPVAILIGLIPVTIAGMGTRDSAIIYFFGYFASPSICLGVGLLYVLFGYWFLGMLGLPIMKKML